MAAPRRRESSRGARSRGRGARVSPGFQFDDDETLHEQVGTTSLLPSPRLRVSSSRCLEPLMADPLGRGKFTRRRGAAEGGEEFSEFFGSTTTRPSTNKSASPLPSPSPRLRVSSSRCPKAAHGQTLSVGESSRGGAEPRKGARVFTEISVRRRRTLHEQVGVSSPSLSASPREFFTLSSRHGQGPLVWESHAEARAWRKGARFPPGFQFYDDDTLHQIKRLFPSLHASPRLRVSSSPLKSC